MPKKFVSLVCLTSLPHLFVSLVCLTFARFFTFTQLLHCGISPSQRDLFLWNSSSCFKLAHTLQLFISTEPWKT